MLDTPSPLNRYPHSLIPDSQYQQNHGTCKKPLEPLQISLEHRGQLFLVLLQFMGQQLQVLLSAVDVDGREHVAISAKNRIFQVYKIDPIYFIL